MIEATLIQKLRNGEEPAFTEMVLTTSQRLMTVARIYTHSLEDAQDVLQDAYIICFEKINSFSGNEPKAFYGWMKRITINLALSKNKKKYRTKETSLELIKTETPFDAQILSGLSSQEIMSLVFNLTPGYRQVFALFVIEGYSHKEIAEQLGISPSTSRSQFIRAKRVLQKKVKQLQNFDVA